MRAIALFCIVFLFNTLHLNLEAQLQVTLQNCMDWAVGQSSENVQKNLNEQLLKVKLKDVSSHLYPSLEMNGIVSYQSHVPQLPLNMGVDVLSKDQYAISLDFAQMVYDGNQFLYNRQYERMMNQNELYQLDLTLNKIKEQIVSIYLNLLIIDKKVELISIVETTINEQLEKHKTLLKEGVISGNIISQLELEKLKIEQQKGELFSIQQSLIQSLSIFTGQELQNCTFETPQIPQIGNNLISKRLEFSIFETTKSGLEYQRKLSVSKSLPKVSLFASGGYGRPTYDIFANQFDWFYRVGLKVNVPVISWAKTAGMGDIINLQKRLVESKKADFQKYNQIEIQEKWNEIQKLEQLLRLDKEIALKQAEITQSFKIQLANGSITAYEYIKQQNDELQSLINQEVHKMQLLKARYELLALHGML